MTRRRRCLIVDQIIGLNRCDLVLLSDFESAPAICHPPAIPKRVPKKLGHGSRHIRTGTTLTNKDKPPPRVNNPRPSTAAADTEITSAKIGVTLRASRARITPCPPPL
jgi:hypothetical protein